MILVLSKQMVSESCVVYVMQSCIEQTATSSQMWRQAPFWVSSHGRGG
jgi:hypothetical protein